MEDQPQVVLLGDSVLMDSVAKSLIDRQFSGVVRVFTDLRNINQPEISLKPNLIIYEYDAKFTHHIHSFLSNHPDTLLLAIDLHCNQVLVFDCRLRPTHSMQELCELIKEEIQHCARRKEAI